VPLSTNFASASANVSETNSGFASESRTDLFLSAGLPDGVPAASDVPDTRKIACWSSLYVAMREIVLIKDYFRNRCEARFHL